MTDQEISAIGIARPCKKCRYFVDRPWPGGFECHHPDNIETSADYINGKVIQSYRGDVFSARGKGGWCGVNGSGWAPK